LPDAGDRGSTLRTARSTVLYVTIATTVAMLGLAVTVVNASHSSDNLRYWDENNNNLPDSDGAVFYAKGSVWTTAMVDRLSDAAFEWYLDTLWNPVAIRWTSSVTETNRFIYYLAPPGRSGCTFSTERAVTCIQIKGSGTNPFEIDLLETAFNSDKSWSFSSSNLTGSGYLDFQGIATHELGHGGGLYDLCFYIPGECDDQELPYCQDTTDIFTMCSGGSRVHSWNKRSLTAEDVASANELYTP
jgi:hypothetical protein